LHFYFSSILILLLRGEQLYWCGKDSVCLVQTDGILHLHNLEQTSHEWGQDRNCLIFDIDTCAILSPSCQGFMWKLFFIIGRILRYFCSLDNIFYVDGQLLRRSVPNSISKIKQFRSCPHSWLITGFVNRLTRRMSLVEQVLLTLPEHMSSPSSH
jgi:hypothetical protein